MNIKVMTNDEYEVSGEASGLYFVVYKDQINNLTPVTEIALIGAVNDLQALRAQNKAQAEVIEKLREALMNSTRFLQETDAQFPNHAYSLTVRNIEHQIKDNLNTLRELESK